MSNAFKPLVKERVDIWKQVQNITHIEQYTLITFINFYFKKCKESLSVNYLILINTGSHFEIYLHHIFVADPL